MQDFEAWWKEAEADADRLLAEEERVPVKDRQPLARRAWNGLKYIYSFRWLTWWFEVPDPDPDVDGMACKGPCDPRPDVPPGYQLEQRPPPPTPMKSIDHELQAVFTDVQRKLCDLLVAEKMKLAMTELDASCATVNERRAQLGLPPIEASNIKRPEMLPPAPGPRFVLD